MNCTFMKRAILASVVAGALSSATANAALISNWTGTDGGSGSWGTINTIAPTPGWDTVIAPNGVGDTAQMISPISVANAVAIQNTAGPTAVTLGTLSYGANNDMGNFSWTITNTNGIIANQDGASPGFATISNSSTNTGANNALIISGSTLSLADDLHITNTTTGSTANGGAIQLATGLTGSGNITFNSSQAIDTGMTATRAQGSIRLSTVGTGFVGTATVEKGLVVLAAVNVLGTAAANTITLGTATADSASLMLQGTTTFTIPNNIVVAAGNTGTLTLGAAGTIGSGGAFNGSITLNSNLTITNVLAAADFINLNGKITGPGGLTKTGVGTISLNPAQPSAAANDYVGDTIIDAGNLSVFTGGSFGLNAIPDGAGKGNLIVNSPGIFAVSGTETINGLSGGGFVQATTNSGAHTLVVGANNATSTFTGVMRNSQTSSRVFTLSKTGTGTLTLSGANTYTGTTTVNDGTLQFAKQVSLYNNALASWTANNIRVNAGATAAFNVGGTGEFTAANIAAIQPLSAAATNSGFGNGSFIGLDTTNAAGGEFIYSTAIANTNTSANAVGLKKLGINTLTLTGINTYTGTTSVLNGILLANGTHTGGGAYTVSSGATLGGTGSIDASVAVNSGGFLSPGASIESLDVGSVSGAGTLLIEYDGDVVTPIDLLNVAANLDVSAMALDFNNIDGLLTPLPIDGGGFGTGAYVFAKYGSLTGTFASVSDLPAGYYVEYAYNDGISSNNIAVVPEPSTLFLTGTGLLALALIRKRRMS
jgi:autotransporter-associated beta strand protein